MESALHRVTALKIQTRDPNRVNVFIDGKYRLSLEIAQVADLGLKVNTEYSEAELKAFEDESQYGKLYARSLEYVLMRPRSQREMRDYLYRKTRDTRTKTGNIRQGVSKELTERVFQRLLDRGYLDDEKFARFWVENRQLRKGISLRKITAELQSKGISPEVTASMYTESERSELDELRKVVAKKAYRYSDQKKLMAYLAQQGFRYDDIKTVLNETSEEV